QSPGLRPASGTAVPDRILTARIPTINRGLWFPAWVTAPARCHRHPRVPNHGMQVEPGCVEPDTFRHRRPDTTLRHTHSGWMQPPICVPAAAPAFPATPTCPDC